MSHRRSFCQLRPTTLSRAPLVPLVIPLAPPGVSLALLEAWGHRQAESWWVLWHWRDAKRHIVLQAMYQSLRRVEARAGVPHVPGRGFHAFRRSLATLLAENLGVKQAAEWLRDTLQVTAETYIQPTRETQRAAAEATERMLQIGRGTARQPRREAR